MKGSVGPKGRESLRFRFTVALFLGFLGFEAIRRLLAYAIPIALRPLNGSSVLASTLELGLSLLAAAVAAYLFSNLVARWMTDRLARFAQMVTARPVSRPNVPAHEAPLPGPFDDTGNDEIAAMARAMNRIRQQFEEQGRAFSLRDIRGREWIAQVSHDLRTPLTAQTACLDRAVAIIENENTPLNRAELTEMLAVAKLDGDRVQVIADDLLEIARLEAGDRLQLEPVPPVELVRQAARGLEPWAAQKGIEIRVDAAAFLPMLHADGRRLMRAIENLIRNALQHANSEVTVLAMLSEDHVRFEVRDDGRGLPKEAEFLRSLRQKTHGKRLRDLAKRRSRADSAGLGLTVTQRVAEAHGGRVDAYNLSSGGAAFFIDIPVPVEEFAQGDE